MATHDYVLANQSGSSFRNDLNNALAAIVSQNSSATEPATTFAYQYWIDTSANPDLVKQRNSANDAWITLGQLEGQLYIENGTAAAPGLSFVGDTDTGVQRVNADKLALATGGENRLVCDENGRVGIGTQTPSETLEVRGDGLFLQETSAAAFSINTQLAGTNDAVLRLQKARGGTGGPSQINAGDELGTIQLRGYDGSSYASAFVLKAVSTTNSGNFAADVKFTQNGSERMRIKSDGDIKIFTDLIIDGDIKNNDSISQGSNGYDIQDVGLTKFARNVNNLTTMFQVFGGDGKFQLKGDGNAENTNNSYGGSSDSKLKENIVDANSQWDDIKAIRVRNYNFKAETNYPTHTQIGVVAQELETVCPGLVQDNIDEDADGNDLGTTTKSVSYSVLYMKAVKALQEAMTRIETLEAKVAALEAGN